MYQEKKENDDDWIVALWFDLYWKGDFFQFFSKNILSLWLKKWINKWKKINDIHPNMKAYYIILSKLNMNNIVRWIDMLRTNDRSTHGFFPNSYCKNNLLNKKINNKKTNKQPKKYISKFLCYAILY